MLQIGPWIESWVGTYRLSRLGAKLNFEGFDAFRCSDGSGSEFAVVS